jgi:hypothetical protein
MSNPRNPEYPGDQVGRPEDEKDQAAENFQIDPEKDRGKTKTVIVGKEPTFPGETAEERSKNYWRRVRNTSKTDESRD